MSIYFVFFLSEGDFEDFEEASETAEAIAALKESIFNMLAGFHWDLNKDDTDVLLYFETIFT